jgi:purine-binding chemotaxis protein CheW
MSPNAYVIFSINDQWYAITVAAVRQIIRSVQLTPVHEGPELLQGLINMNGEIIPVINIRKQFKFADREISLSDRIIVTSSLPYAIAFIVDQIEGVVELSKSDITPSEAIFPKMEDYIIGTAKYNGHTALIYDIGSLFPQPEIKKITLHLKQAQENS